MIHNARMLESGHRQKNNLAHRVTPVRHGRLSDRVLGALFRKPWTENARWCCRCLAHGIGENRLFLFRVLAHVADTKTSRNKLNVPVRPFLPDTS